jgi:tRNA pseudouridine13 synthase
MLSYLSKTSGIGGTLKSAPEDFLVEEISPDGEIFELDKTFSKPDSPGSFVHFILQKKDWSTQGAISELADRLHSSHSRFNAAGNKDKVAITTQLVSAQGVRKEDVMNLKVKDIKINGAWTAAERVNMGSLLGNRFTITVRGPREGAVEKCETIKAELNSKFPNYFGEQRFGSSRKNTAQVGMMLISGDLEGAARSFLIDSEGEEHEEARLARKELDSNGDYNKALKVFPRHLRLERSMLAHLAKRDGDFAGAFKQLPRSTLLMFIHAVQSMMFNVLLSDRITEGALELERGEYFCGERLGFPDIGKAEAEGWICGKLIGYQTSLNEREKRLMGELNISKDEFRMKAIPEVGSKGSYRTLLAPMKDFNLSEEKGLAFRFSLQSGSYATVAMREFIKGEKGPESIDEPDPSEGE